MSKITTLNLEALLLSLLLVGTWALLMVFPVPSVPSPMDLVASLVPAHLRDIHRAREREREKERERNPTRRIAGAASRARTELSQRMQTDRNGNGHRNRNWTGSIREIDNSALATGIALGAGLRAGLSAGASVCWSSHTIPGGLRATADASGTPAAASGPPGYVQNTPGDASGKGGHASGTVEGASGTAGGAPGRPGDAWGVPWAPGAVVFQGQCGVCMAGALCAFHMVVRSPAQWVLEAHPRQRELRVLLEGPSRGLAHVLPLPPLDGSAFQITYQLWDPGMYRVSVRIPCGTLRWRHGDDSDNKPQELATWQLLVAPPQGMAGGGAPLSTNTTTKSGPASPQGPLHPSDKSSHTSSDTSSAKSSRGSISISDHSGSIETRQKSTASNNDSRVPSTLDNTLSSGQETTAQASGAERKPRGPLREIQPRKLKASENSSEPQAAPGTGSPGGKSTPFAQGEPSRPGIGGSETGALQSSEARFPWGGSIQDTAQRREEIAALEAAASGPGHTHKYSVSEEGAYSEEGSAETGPGEGAALGGVGRGEARLEGDVMARPCEGSSLQARWLRQGDGSYKWTPYECSKSIPVQDWIPSLNEAGIKEISFIGDSHQRVLTHHILSLLSGRLRPDQAKWRASMRYNITHPGGGWLRLNMYFIKGIYHSNDAFGCGLNFRQNNSKPFFPAISPTADVNILEAGYWTGAYCKRPEHAFAANLPRFLLWMENTLKAFSVAAKAAAQKAASQQPATQQPISIESASREGVRKQGQTNPSQNANPPKGLQGEGKGVPRRGLRDAAPRDKGGAPNRSGSAAAPASATAALPGTGVVSANAAAPGTGAAVDAGVAAATAKGGKHLEVAHQPLLVYRSTPPRPTDTLGCDPFSNVYIQYANEVARGLAPQLNATFFDSSLVEGPRYLDTCDKHHYSCVANGKMVGEVGEADAAALVHFLIREQHKRQRVGVGA